MEPGTAEPSGGRAARAARAAARLVGRLAELSAPVRIALGVAATILLLGVALDVGTSSPKLCASCHEMGARTRTWSESAHSTVKCVRCHQPATEWHGVPKRVVDRFTLLWRDVRAHGSGDYEDPVDSAVPGGFRVTDDVCLQCHDPNRKATSGFRILIDHAGHAKRNGSCISCHVRTAHPLETRGRAMSLMTQCFTCHGTPEQPKASADCGTCHPDGYDLFPASHLQATWKQGHGDVYLSDTRQCVMCHEQRFCDDCHGLEMPHPSDWDKSPTGHALIAETNREVCGRCHGTRPDMCTMCHHASYDPTRGTWIEQHHLEVEEEGTAYCLSCHGPLSCGACHAQRVGDAASDPD